MLVTYRSSVIEVSLFGCWLAHITCESWFGLRLLDLLSLYFDLMIDYLLILLKCFLYFIVGCASTLHLQFAFYKSMAKLVVWKLLTFFQCVDLFDEYPSNRLFTLVHIIVTHNLLYRVC